MGAFSLSSVFRLGLHLAGMASLSSCQMSCVAERMLVSTPAGEIPIEALKVGQLIYSFDLRSGTLVPTKLTHIRSGHKAVLAFLLEGGEALFVTKEHPVYSPESKCYEPAEVWHRGERRAVLWRGERCRVVGIEERSACRVFDLTVESEHHNFVANGVLVHNKTPPPMIFHEEDWVRVVDQENFDEESIASLAIGANEGSWQNRGSIEIALDGPPGKISVDMRRFGWSSRGLEDAIEGLAFWATDPLEAIESQSCVGAWKEGCWITIGPSEGTMEQGMLTRQGADFRVVLPQRWAGKLVLRTTDALAEYSQPRRSDVTVRGARGGVDIEAWSGEISVELARDAVEDPSCSLEEIEACKAGDWDSGCGCTNFAEWKVTGVFANTTIDIPTDFWATVQLTHEEEGCSRVIACDGFVDCGPVVTNHLHTGAELNNHGWENGGAHFELGNLGCGEVEVAQPDGAVEDELRGEVRVCTGCL